MNFLEAHKLVRGFAGGPPLPFLLAMSGTAEPMALYLRAAAAKAGREAQARTLPFNTLAQTLHQPPRDNEAEVFLLLPWDLAPVCDWRTGLPANCPPSATLIEAAAATLSTLTARPRARTVYVPAPLPPLYPDPGETASLAAALTAMAAGAGAIILPQSAFALGGHFASGCPIAGESMGIIAETVIGLALDAPAEPAKVLVTDLDNVMWRGIIAEAGLDGIACHAEGPGFCHFVYQTLLLRLKAEGVVLAAVSRNDPADALAPFRAGLTKLAEDDFVAIVASYEAKSSQIRMLAGQLNLGLSSFVFVDDNPLELAEVEAALPEVATVAFPADDALLPGTLDAIARRFARKTITAEDRDRTALYRRRLAGMAPSHAQGADLATFLAGLGMHLTIHDRSRGDRTRAIQLINKTNQFNLNGRRWADDEVAAILAQGGRLLTASVRDNHGDHGEILACLIGAEGNAEALVMSCRVFQRRIEHAFLTWLVSRGDAPHAFRVIDTERNEPLRKFLEDEAFAPLKDGLAAFDASAFAARHGGSLTLFTLEVP